MDVDCSIARSPIVQAKAEANAKIGKRKSVTMAKGSWINQATKIPFD